MCFVAILLLTTFHAFGQRPKSINEEQVVEPLDSISIDQTNVEYHITQAMHFLVTENKVKALDYFLKAHELMPSNAAVNHAIANIYQQQGNYSKAAYYAKLAFESDPKNHFYAASLASIQTAQGNLRSAIETFEAMYKNSEEAPDEYLLELAALYLYEGKAKKALETYDRIEKRLGILEEVSVQKQKIYLQENDLEGALKEGDRLVKAYPYIGAYVVEQAQMMLSNGKEEEAVSYLSEYLIENPNQPKVHLKLAEIYQQEAELAKAIPHFEKAFSSEEISLRDKLNNFVPLVQTIGDSSLLINLGNRLVKVHPNEANAFAANGDMYFALNQKDKALENYRKAIGYNASNMQLWQNILNLEFEQNNYKQVANYAEEALSYFPNQAVFYLYAGTAYFSLKDYKKAIRNWEQGASITFGNDELKSTFHAQLGDAYHAEKENKKAYSNYEQAIKYNPDNFFAINNYTYYLALEKLQLEKAESLASRMVKNNPTNGTFIDTYGWVLFQREKYTEAVKQLEKASQLSPSPTILEHYGDALYKAGQLEKAIQQWRKALEKGNGTDLLKKKIEEEKYYE